MIKSFFQKAVLIAITLVLNHSGYSQTDSSYIIGKELILKMCAQVDSIKTLGVTMNKQERVEGTFREQTSSFKLQMNPLKVYIHQDAPKKGLEVLYKEGFNENKLLVNPSGFPWINVHLNPYGKTARDGQHHTIHDSGLKVVCDIVKSLIMKYERLADTLVQLDSTTAFITPYDTTECAIISLTNPFYNIETYTVKEGEDLTSIAKSKFLCPYKVLELNKHRCDFYDDVEAEDEIFIPNDYAINMVITLELERMIPRKIEVWDKEGKFEIYTYQKVEINPSYTPLDFSPENESYGF